MAALPTAEVEEAVHADGDVDVRARAQVARRDGLPIDSALDGSILGGHDVLGVSPSLNLTAELSTTSARWVLMTVHNTARREVAAKKRSVSGVTAWCVQERPS